jgi:hypothetical protein
MFEMHHGELIVTARQMPWKSYVSAGGALSQNIAWVVSESSALAVKPIVQERSI